MSSHSIPLSLYVHIPWCVKKCPYCDFNSHAKTENLPEEAYIKALLQDLDQDLLYDEKRTIKSIFFGGGTPSLFSPQSIEKILTGIQQRLHLAQTAEITLEANPGTLEHKSFKDYQAAGINRVSLGVQSFQDDKLKALGRIHSHREAEMALDSLKNTNLTFNIDLMYGLPNQSIENSLFDLEKALEFFPDHLSWYNLTLEPNTVFHAKPPPLPNDDIIHEMQTHGFSRLQTAGFHHYEISAFSKPHFPARHNLNYWEFGDYLGIGAGAHGKISHHSAEGLIITRYAKKRYPKSYLQSTDFVAEKRQLTAEDLPFEFMLNALRLNDGFSEELFEERTHLEINKIAPILNEAHTKNLLSWQNKHIQTTSLGKRFLNDVMQLFLTNH